MKTYTSKNCDSHVILYAKNHYERGDLITDLKRIYSLRNAIDPEHISKSDILSCLINLVEKFVGTISFISSSRILVSLIIDKHFSMQAVSKSYLTV